MSFVVFKKEEQDQFQHTANEAATSEKSSGLSMKIDVVPIPVSSEQVNVSMKSLQNTAIQNNKNCTINHILLLWLINLNRLPKGVII